MLGLDIAPQPFVGFVADREIIDIEPPLARLLDVVEEQEVAGAGMGEIVLGDRPELADQPLAATARSENYPRSLITSCATFAGTSE